MKSFLQLTKLVCCLSLLIVTAIGCGNKNKCVGRWLYTSPRGESIQIALGEDHSADITALKFGEGGKINLLAHDKQQWSEHDGVIHFSRGLEGDTDAVWSVNENGNMLTLIFRNKNGSTSAPLTFISDTHLSIGQNTTEGLCAFWHLKSERKDQDRWLRFDKNGRGLAFASSKMPTEDKSNLTYVAYDFLWREENHSIYITLPYFGSVSQHTFVYLTYNQNSTNQLFLQEEKPSNSLQDFFPAGTYEIEKEDPYTPIEQKYLLDKSSGYLHQMLSKDVTAITPTVISETLYRISPVWYTLGQISIDRDVAHDENYFVDYDHSSDYDSGRLDRYFQEQHDVQTAYENLLPEDIKADLNQVKICLTSWQADLDALNPFQGSGSGHRYANNSRAARLIDLWNRLLRIQFNNQVIFREVGITSQLWIAAKPELQTYPDPSINPIATRAERMNRANVALMNLQDVCKKLPEEAQRQVAYFVAPPQ